MLGAVIFFFIVGKIADRIYNQTEDLRDFEISSRAEALHQKLLVADLHADNLLWDRDPLTRKNHGHVDIPRLIEGNYALQVFDAVIKVPKDINYTSNNDRTDATRTLVIANRWPFRTWFSEFERAIYQSQKLHEAAEESSSLEIIRNQSDLRYFMGMRKSNSYRVGGVLALEGMHAIEDELGNVDRLFDAGYRIMGLVHFFDNEVGGSSAGEEQGGLTDLGYRVIRRMEEKKIIIDLAHASPTLINEVLEVATRPVIVSHTGVKGIHKSPRNLSDTEIRKIAENGGLIGIGFWPEAAGDGHPLSIARSIRYVIDMVGIEHVALGSDFDGAVTTMFDASEIAYLTEALIQEGFSDDQIQKIMGQNIIAFLQKNLPE